MYGGNPVNSNARSAIGKNKIKIKCKKKKKSRFGLVAKPISKEKIGKLTKFIPPTK
jgi:hypothetical protein